MAAISAERAPGRRAGAMLLACVAESGSASHPYFIGDALRDGPDSVRNLADIIHFLCVLHGRIPGIVDLAATRALEPEARAWLIPAAEAFSAERHYLARLAVTAGPVPSTPGGGTSEAAVNAQRHAVATLVQSERKGCALGAAIAFAADWAPIRSVLDHAARRLGIEIPDYKYGNAEELRMIADNAASSPAVERAMLFGAGQIAIQHRGFWDLLESRAEARLGC